MSCQKGLLKGFREVEITEYEIVTLRKAVQDLPVAAQVPVTRLVGNVRPILLSIDAF
jgi:hypothetical protein